MGTGLVVNNAHDTRQRRSMIVCVALASLITACAMWEADAETSPPSSKPVIVPLIEPVVLIDAAILKAPEFGGLPVGDRHVRGCGVRAIFPSGPVIELVNLRSGDALELQLTAHGFQSPFDGAERVALQTSGEDTATLLPPLEKIAPEPQGADLMPTEGMRVGARRRIDPDAGARLFQQLMIGGATVTIGSATGGDILTIPGPLPHTVRTGFLNCSGDLFPRTR